MSNHSIQDKIIVASAVAGGLIFFALLTSKCNPLAALPESPSTNDTIEQTSSESDSDQVAELRSQISELNKEVSDLENQKNKLNAALHLATRNKESSSSQPHSTTEGSSNEVKDLSETSGTPAPAISQAQYDNLVQKNAELDAELTNARKKTQNLVKQTNELNAVLTEATSIINLKSEETLLQGAMRLRQKSNDQAASIAIQKIEIADLKKKHTNLLNSSKNLQDVTTLYEQLEQQKKLQRASKTQLDILKAKLTQKEAEADHTAKLLAAARKQQTLIAAKNKQIRALNAQINQFKAASSVFVESADALPKNAKNLFADLQKLEGKPQTEIVKAYLTFKATHKASALSRVTFASGKADVSAADIAKIKEITRNNDENAYFLIVGFADNTGNAASNKTLSSQRSTNVAKEINKNKKGFQAAQAVYLGQTTRFGEPDQNRVVEIWKIN